MENGIHSKHILPFSAIWKAAAPQAQRPSFWLPIKEKKTLKNKQASKQTEKQNKSVFKYCSSWDLLLQTERGGRNKQLSLVSLLFLIPCPDHIHDSPALLGPLELLAFPILQQHLKSELHFTHCPVSLLEDTVWNQCTLVLGTKGTVFHLKGIIIKQPLKRMHQTVFWQLESQANPQWAFEEPKWQFLLWAFPLFKRTLSKNDRKNSEWKCTFTKYYCYLSYHFQTDLYLWNTAFLWLIPSWEINFFFIPLWREWLQESPLCSRSDNGSNIKWQHRHH